MMNSPFSMAVALGTTMTTNLLNPAAAGSGTGYTPTASYIIVRHVRIVNTSTAAATVSLWKGLTHANTAGTEFAWSGKSVPGNDAIDWYGYSKFLSTDFLVGGAGTASSLTLNLEGEIGLVP